MIGRRSFLALAAVPLLVEPRQALADALQEPLLAYERKTGGRVGIYAANSVTGAHFAWRADELFVMCSTFKLSLAAFALYRADRGELGLNEVIRYGPDALQEYAPEARRNLARGGMSIHAMCKAAVEWSDNTCANLVLARLGGPPALTAFWRTIGDGTSRLDHDEPLLNRSPPGDPHDATTPRAMAGNVHRLILNDVLRPPSRAILTDWILGCRTGDDRLRGGLPGDWDIGDKTGNNGKDAFGDIAVAWPTTGGAVVVSVYTQGGAPAPAQVQEVFAEIGRTILPTLV